MPNNTTPATLPILAFHYPTPDLDADDLADAPEAPDQETDAPDEPQQAALPTGPSHVAARGTPRTAAQLSAARTFLGAAGKVAFSHGQATLKAVWMTFAYYASLGDGRVCFATVETLADRALVTERTVRRCVLALIDRGLIESDNRKGGHAPTTWTIHAFSPSVLGGQDVRPGGTGCPPRGDRMSAEVRDVRSAPTEQDVHLASKQQPVGACAPPAARKNTAATTKNTQSQTEGPEPTRTPEPTQTLAPAKTDTGGVTQGGASDKQIAYLHVLADKVGAEPAEDLWRAADPKRLQAQIKAAKIVRKRIEQGGEKHTHEANEEKILRVGIFETFAGKDGVQRCECGAARAAWVHGDGKASEFQPWTLCGYLVDYLLECSALVGPQTDQELAEAEADGLLEALTTRRWAVPMTVSEAVRELCETAPKMNKEEAKRCFQAVGDCMVDVPADWRPSPRGRV